MTVSLSGSLWTWALRLVAFLYFIIIVFSVAVPTWLLGAAWAALFIFSFVTIAGNNPPA